MFLCNSTEKNSPFYSVCLHRYPTDALGEHLENECGDNDWFALIDVHGVRERAIPDLSFFKHVLPSVAVLVSTLALFGNAREEPVLETLMQWINPKSWVSEPLALLTGVAVLYVVLAVLSLILTLGRERYRSRRAGNMLAYMAFREQARQRRTSSA